MKAYEYIKAKQNSWALNNKIALIGSKGERGKPAYTTRLEDNLFEPLDPEAKKDINEGDGGELKGNPPKMHALHSSSALGINVFHYWKRIDKVVDIAAACGFCGKENNFPNNIRFEQKYPIHEKFKTSPNLDIVIENLSQARFKVFAIESKFSEAYAPQGHLELKQKYIKLTKIWDDVPNLYQFAKYKDEFKYLHSAQLVKHILGLKNKIGKEKFRLLYLWYDCLGYEGAKHRDEIEQFVNITKKDSINFHALSYQDLIVKLSNEYRSEHESYIKYISSRYL